MATAERWLVLWGSWGTRRLGKIPLTPRNRDILRLIFNGCLTDITPTGTEHWNLQIIPTLEQVRHVRFDRNQDGGVQRPTLESDVPPPKKPKRRPTRKAAPKDVGKD
jgi:hypothetical protein